MNDTCCAHSKVVLKHEDFPGGYRSDYWECESGCGAKFYPAQTDQAGIRLRDWFAGMALQGYNSQADSASASSAKIACWSYQDADAMLQERMKPKP